MSYDSDDGLFAETNASTFQKLLIEQHFATGVSGLICGTAITVISIIEAVYICHYRTTFLQRLWFYLTITLAVLNGCFAVNWGRSFITPNTLSLIVVVTLLASAIFFTLTFEVLLISSINLTILSKMYKHAVGRQSASSHPSYMLCCCLHTKGKEALFMLLSFILSLTLTSIYFVTEYKLATSFQSEEIYDVVGNSFNFVIVTSNLLFSLISFALSVWFCVSRKKRVPSQNIKVKRVYKRMILTIGFLVVFGILLWLLSLLPLATLQPGVLITSAAVTPLLHSMLTLPFFAYTCKNIHDHQRNTQKFPTTMATTDQSTAPTSVSTDMSEHAPQFLSPSTAELSEKTELIT